MLKKTTLLLILLSTSLFLLSQSNYPCSSPGNAGTLYASGSAAVSASFTACSNYSPAKSNTTITDCFIVNSSSTGTLGAVQLFTNSGPASCDNRIATSRIAKYNINISSFAKGIYYIKIKNGTFIKTKKLIIN